MAHSTVEACEFVRRLDSTGNFDDTLHDTKQKAATDLLRDEFQQQDFTKPVS